MASLLTRILKEGVPPGDDIYGVKRSVCRALDAHDSGRRLAVLEADDAAAKRTYGPFFKKQVNECRKVMGFAQTGIVDQNFWNALVRGGWPDARAIELMNNYIDAHPGLALCYPVPQGQVAGVCQGLHPTAGLDGNYAIDFCCAPGTTVVAVETGVITKLSGRSPNQDTWDNQGVFGYSIHLRTGSGYRYFITHLGSRARGMKVGMTYEVGDLIGKVGDQHFRPDHIHYGVTSPVSTADAKKRITAVSRAPRIE